MENPKIRFRSFSGPWKKERLGDLVDRGGSGGTPDSANQEFYGGGIPFLSISDITKSDGFITDTEKTLTKLGLDNSTAVIFPKGTVSLAMYASFGKVCILGEDAATSQAFYNMVFDKDEIRNFVYQRLVDASEENEWLTLVSTGTQPNLNAKKVCDFDFLVPEDLKEAKTITDFLFKIDGLLSSQEQKIQRLMETRKSMLEKMFPENGSLIPEIRFSEFHGPWVKAPLNKYLVPSDEKNEKGVFGKEDVLSVSGEYGVLNQIEYQGRSFAGVSTLNYGVLRHEGVVYTKSPLSSNPYGIIKANRGKDGIVSTLYAVYFANPETCFSNFVECYFDAGYRLNNYLHPLVNKGAKNDMKVSAKNALLGEVCFPSIQEQKKISSFFDDLDGLIWFENAKYQKLSSLKIALHKQMFF
jgi:type I restriction enzyme, S subunit